VKKLGNKEKLMLKYFGIFALIALGFQYTLIQPTRLKIAQKKEEIQKINDEIQRAYEFLRDLNRIREEADKMEELWQIFKTKLPDSKQIPILLNALAEVANKADINYVSISTKPMEAGEQQGSLAYKRLPIEITLRCRYRNLGEYLANLRDMPRLVKVESLKIFRNKDILPNVDVTINVYTYVLTKEG
jgi:Tfp pilus assembly protein PilO